MIEIKFCGRGGQGVMMASQILGLAFFKAGMYPQCYSVYGGERRGAPVVAFLRVDREKILLKCEIKSPDELIYLDASLLDPQEVAGMLRRGGRILVNTDRPLEAFEVLDGFDVALIDAGGISASLDLGRVINTTVLGAYCRFTGHITMGTLLEAIEEMVPAQKRVNREAASRAFEEVILRETSG
jgi:2-oxoacid:acceptor oxidoreductase gamma subunit (pyruvate/2-ketoisovalerate family)